MKVLLKQLIEIIDEIEYYFYFEDIKSRKRLYRLYIERDLLLNKLINEINGELKL